MAGTPGGGNAGRGNTGRREGPTVGPPGGGKARPWDRRVAAARGWDADGANAGWGKRGRGSGSGALAAWGCGISTAGWIPDR
ncbi:hypothetical protein GCM10022380_77900 [Amycolatopsis tucumanensis]|uniref:Uncharacterized protein n=1 Tax=Amycolatopsis tucumanensis TaxID=401106 RepID=A0ABP7JMW1_9PSEU